MMMTERERERGGLGGEIDQLHIKITLIMKVL
jgi:hypothetical protein